MDESFINELLDNATDGIIIGDANKNIIYINSTLLKLLGISADDVIGKHISLLPWEEQSIKALPFRFDLINQDKTITTTRTLLKKNGQKLPVEMASKLLASGNYQSIIRDITERNIIEQSLIENEKKYRVLFENMIVGFATHEMIYDKNGKAIDYKYIETNPEFEKLTGLKQKDVIGHTAKEIMPNTEQYWIDTYENVTKTGKPMAYENYAQELKKYFNVWAFPINQNTFAVMFTDITDRKIAEKVLSLEKRLFESVIESLPVMLFLKEAKELHFALMNRAGEKLLGIPKEELLGKNDYDIFPKDQAKFFIAKDRETLQKKGHLDISEEPILTKDKGERILRTLKLPIVDKKGKPEFLLGFSIDITDQKFTEREKEKLQKQLAQSQKMESVGQLAGGIAHDFNNMLGVIIGQTELALKKTNHSSPLYPNLLEILKASERSSELTKQLLTFARKQNMSPKIIDLNQTIEELLSLLISLTGENIFLSFVPGKNIGNVYIDPSQLDQILTNICINAKDSIENTGKIIIETSLSAFTPEYCKTHTDCLPGTYIQLIINDDGQGMTDDTLSKIFEPFFTTKEFGKGTGLGLATVYGIVKQNNGFINVSSKPGAGTTFKIYLPKCNESKATESLSNNKTQKDIHNCNKKTILLVEDEPMVREMTTDMLELIGHTVISAKTPEEAIKIATSNKAKIDILLTDMIMPKMNGKELSQKIFSLCPKIKCLFMSGYTAEVIAKHGILETNISFIEKPFTIETLKNKLQEAFNT